MVSQNAVLLSTGNKEKKLALLEIINTLFKVYFQLNTLRLCKTLINAVNSKQFLEFDMFPASQRVTYRYYTGRLNIFDERYVSCLSRLSYSLSVLGTMFASPAYATLLSQYAMLHWSALRNTAFIYHLSLEWAHTCAEPYTKSLRNLSCSPVIWGTELALGFLCTYRCWKQESSEKRPAAAARGCGRLDVCL